MNKPTEDPAVQAKRVLRGMIKSILPYQEDDRVEGAGKVSDHIIDELVKKLKDDGRPKIIYQYSDPANPRPYITVSIDHNQE